MPQRTGAIEQREVAPASSADISREKSGPLSRTTSNGWPPIAVISISRGFHSFCSWNTGKSRAASAKETPRRRSSGSTVGSPLENNVPRSSDSQPLDIQLNTNAAANSPIE